MARAHTGTVVLRDSDGCATRADVVNEVDDAAVGEAGELSDLRLFFLHK